MAHFHIDSKLPYNKRTYQNALMLGFPLKISVDWAPS